MTDARALDPNRMPSQYVREQWTTETRFPGGAVNGIAQTADGYLWVGTDRGLIRFDGFNFIPVSFASSATASNVPVLQLLTDVAGKLWIRPQGGDLVRQKDRGFESVRYGQGTITAVSKDNHDGVVVSDIEQGTFRFMEDHAQKLGPTAPPVISMAETNAAMNEATSLVVMMETTAALENVEEIIATKGVDMLLIGSNDLCAEMGIPGQYDHPRLKAAFARSIDAARKVGKHVGIGGLASRDDLMTQFVQMGARYVSTGTDLSFLLTASAQRAKFVRDIKL